jgi:hypothetical protein
VDATTKGLRSLKQVVATLFPEHATEAVALLAEDVAGFPEDAIGPAWEYVSDWGMRHSGKVLGRLLIGHDDELNDLGEHSERFEDRRDNSINGYYLARTVVMIEDWLPQCPVSAHRREIMEALATVGMLASRNSSWMTGLAKLATQHLYGLDTVDQEKYLEHVAGDLGESLPQNALPEFRDALLEACTPPEGTTDTSIDTRTAWLTQTRKEIGRICDEVKFSGNFDD